MKIDLCLEPEDVIYSVNVSEEMKPTLSRMKCEERGFSLHILLM